jgi:3-phosphoshikimate 1-carboxyvinyltransferase
VKVRIAKSSIHGSVAAPPSKSYTLRGLICAALAGGQSRIINPLVADDSLALRSVLLAIGVDIREEGGGWLVKGGDFTSPASDLYCRDSAGALRFMTALCALAPGICRLTAGTSLARRPVGPLVKALNDLGIRCSSSDGYPPVTVEGGKFKSREVDLPGDISSQFISALLFVAPRAEQGLTVKLTSPPESKPYLLMTLQCLEKFGVSVRADAGLLSFTVKPQSYRPAEYSVEGDWSSASYLMALGAVAGETVVTNLQPASLQADRALPGLLERMGANVSTTVGKVTVKSCVLKALSADMSDCIDLLPTVAALAAVADGVSELRGISRARIKESDRVEAMTAGLCDLGIHVHTDEDTMRITGGKLKGGVIDPRGDHRIAMAFSILGALAGDITIEDAGCVAKTYPHYWDDFNKLGGKTVIHV